MDATTIGVDLAKTVSELALANTAWWVVGRKRLTRAQFDPFLANHPSTHVVMEACATAHYWARRARDLGHRVTLLPVALRELSVRRLRILYRHVFDGTASTRVTPPDKVDGDS